MLSAVGERPLLRRIHVVALALCAVFLPWSTAFLSMAQMLLAANWIAMGIVQRDAATRWRAAFTSGAGLVFLSFLLLHVAGLLWSTDLAWGLDLCRILLPILVFGVVLSGSRPLESGEMKLILLLGAWSALACGLFGLLFSGAAEGDYRSLSMFISHIRLALLLCFATFLFVYHWPRGRMLRALHCAAALTCLYLLSRLESLQGFLILAVIAAVMLWRRAQRFPGAARIAVRSVLIVLPLALLWGGIQLLNARQKPVPAGVVERGERSAGGETYTHDTTNAQTENGTHVWTYIAWEEVHRAWGLRSERASDQLDDKGHPIWSTVVRYLASKGERKDSVSIMALEESEIRAIERGRTNVLEGQRGPLRERIEEVLFELDLYRSVGIANGHSVAMRIEFLKAGWAIARAHWLMGVGTGDTQRAFDAYYAESRSALDPRWRLRAHNEYLTLWISFGILGMLWALFSWWWPAYRNRAWQRPVFIAWAIAFGVSCLTDDTVETQAGATFFAFYYALLVLAAPVNGDSRAPARAPQGSE
ncbi:MAG: O-antigen ligase family protein [Flavobacteriales bacterium]|nr:O-antigen ligase family protein [Flavobacteriales bacterium]